MRDRFDLQRFVEAQEGVHEQALAELAAGRKRTHWIWFVLPQLRGLGRSPMAERYGIADLAEARAYLAHPVLGPRLTACIEALLRVEGRTAHDILGTPDDLKFRSCLTLFGAASPDAPLFAEALARFFDGRPDPATLDLIGA